MLLKTVPSDFSIPRPVHCNQQNFGPLVALEPNKTHIIKPHESPPCLPILNRLKYLHSEEPKITDVNRKLSLKMLRHGSSDLFSFIFYLKCMRFPVWFVPNFGQDRKILLFSCL